MSAVSFNTVTEARKHFRALIDAAETGRPATVRRDNHRAAIVDADRLRDALAARVPSGAQVVAEGGGWSVFLPGLPIAADSATFDDALDEMVSALREYADDWSDHLLHAPNHADNWVLVQLIELSTDEQLRSWLQQ